MNVADAGEVGYRVLWTNDHAPSGIQSGPVRDPVGSLVYPIDEWWRLRVFVYAASESDVGRFPLLRLRDVEGGNTREARTYFFDVRPYLGEDGFMASAGLSNRHDGRHPRAQEAMLGQFASGRIGRLLLSVFDALISEVSRGRSRVFIRLQCTQGRHRSVAAALVVAKLLALLCGIRVICLGFDAPSDDGRHSSRLCSLSHCRQCDEAVDTPPDDEALHTIRHGVVSWLSESLLAPRASDCPRRPHYAALLVAAD